MSGRPSDNSAVWKYCSFTVVFFVPKYLIYFNFKRFDVTAIIQFNRNGKGWVEEGNNNC